MAAGDRSIGISFVVFDALVVKEPNPLIPVVDDAFDDDPDFFLEEDFVADKVVSGVRFTWL